MVKTTLPEKPVVDDMVNIELIEQWIAILKSIHVRHPSRIGRRKEKTNLGDRSCEYNNFVQLSNPLHELVNPRSFDDIDIVIVALDLYRDGEIGLMQYLFRQLARGGYIKYTGVVP